MLLKTICFSILSLLFVTVKEFVLGTNSTWLEKKDGSILIGSLYTDPKAKLQYFKILIPEFVKVLTEWKKLVKRRPKKIIITQLDDGTMTIVGENAKKYLNKIKFT